MNKQNFFEECIDEMILHAVIKKDKEVLIRVKYLDEIAHREGKTFYQVAKETLTKYFLTKESEEWVRKHE